MKCPSCNTEVAEDAAICPNCDHILDPSLFDAEPPRDIDDEPTGAKAIPTGRPVKSTGKPVSGAKKAVKKPVPAGAKKPGAGAPKQVARPGGPRMPDAPPPKLRDGNERGDWRKKVSEEDWGPAPAPRAPEAPSYNSLDPEDAMADVKHFIYELSMADKLALFGAVGMVLACFFPWKETAVDGAVLGVASLGAVTALLAAIAITAIAVRVRKVFARLDSVYPWILQLLAVGGAGFWCLYFIRISWDSTIVRAPVGNYETWVSKPSIGVFVGILATGVSLLGTFFGLKEKR